MATSGYKEGSKGAVVKQIQKVVGCYPDGVWGKVTTECVKAWQREHGLTADGIVGPRTLAAMGIAAVRKSKRRIDEIIIHCTATPEGQPRTVEQIRQDHIRNRGFADIGYHYIIYLDGTVHEGRNIDIAGAHATNHNAHSIGVVYVGGVENDPKKAYKDLKPKDTRTEEQKASLLSLLMDLRKLYPTARIIGHRDVSSKACPSFDAKAEYRKI